MPRHVSDLADVSYNLLESTRALELHKDGTAAALLRKLRSRRSFQTVILWCVLSLQSTYIVLVSSLLSDKRVIPALLWQHKNPL